MFLISRIFGRRSSLRPLTLIERRDAAHDEQEPGSAAHQPEHDRAHEKPQSERTIAQVSQEETEGRGQRKAHSEGARQGEPPRQLAPGSSLVWQWTARGRRGTIAALARAINRAEASGGAGARALEELRGTGGRLILNQGIGANGRTPPTHHGRPRPRNAGARARGRPRGVSRLRAHVRAPDPPHG